MAKCMGFRKLKSPPSQKGFSFNWVVATQIFFKLSPRNLGKMNPYLLIAYFSNGLVKNPPTSLVFRGWLTVPFFSKSPKDFDVSKVVDPILASYRPWLRDGCVFVGGGSKWW